MSGLHKRRTCEVCAVGYQPTYSRQRTCGRSCGLELRRNEGTLRTKEPLRIAAEKSHAAYRQNNQLQRSVKRQSLSKAERAHAYYLKHYATNKHVYYKAAYKRRALIKGADYQHIQRQDVFNSDNWTCRNCRCTVSDDVKRGHPRKAIMAHIVALAAGGAHTRDNVCTLCHHCNSRDGVNRIPIQTHLFNLA